MVGARYVFLVRFVCARGGWLGGGGSPDGSGIDWAMCGSGSVRGMGGIAWGDALGFMLVGPCAVHLDDSYFLCTPTLCHILRRAYRVRSHGAFPKNIF